MATHTYCCTISFLVTSELDTFEAVVEKEPKKIIDAIIHKVDDMTVHGVDSVNVECFDSFSDRED